MTRRSRSSARRFGLAAVPVAISVAALAAYACSAPGEARPVASFATTAAAGMDFALIREAWQDPEHIARAQVRAMLERYVATYPKDGLVPTAHALLAFLAMDENELARADAEVRLAGSHPTGTTADLIMTARARWLRLHGRSAEAMTLLRPNVGKNVDPIVRNLFQEELALAALGTGETHDKYEAIAYMDAWLQGAGEEEREATRAKVAAIVGKLPREVLFEALRVMRSRGGSYGYGKEMFKIVAARLASLALQDGDAELARLLMDPDAGAIAVEGDAGIALAELATSRRGLNVIEGRTIGLLLPTENPALRDESAEVLRGVMWALGKPRGIRQLLPMTSEPAPRSKARAAQDAGSLTSCARTAEAEDASLTSDEPKDDDRIQLVTRDDSGSSDRTESSLDELVGQGASVIVAALDPDTAERVATWSASRNVPVIILAAPSAPAPGSKTRSSGFGFVLGESRVDVETALARDVPDLLKGNVAAVVDASELSHVPAAGGEWGPFKIQPPVSCDANTPHAGDPRFPVASWEKASTRAWLVTGSPSCARDLIAELSTHARNGTVALTLEAASEPPPARGVKVMTAAAGILPIVSASILRDSELSRFVAAFGAPRLTWWTALGRDAATLARRVVMTLPTDNLTAPDAVAKRRDLAQKALAKLRVRLWSTEARGFDGASTMARTICVLNLAAR